jgi:type IV secretory pathway TrbD component
MADSLVDSWTFPDAAASILFLVGAIALLVGLGLVLWPLPELFGVGVPPLYRYLLVVLAMVGGSIHLLVSRWCRDRKHLFRVAAGTLIGMVLLQISVPLDILAIAFLVLGREEFES